MHRPERLEQQPLRLGVPSLLRLLDSREHLIPRGGGVALLVKRATERVTHVRAAAVLDAAPQRTLRVFPSPVLQEKLPNLPEQGPLVVGQAAPKCGPDGLLSLRSPVREQRHEAQVAPHARVGVVLDVCLGERSLGGLQVALPEHRDPRAQPGGRTRAHLAPGFKRRPRIREIAVLRQRPPEVEDELEGGGRTAVRLAGARHRVRVRLHGIREVTLLRVQVAQELEGPRIGGVNRQGVHQEGVRVLRHALEHRRASQADRSNERGVRARLLQDRASLRGHVHVEE